MPSDIPGPAYRIHTWRLVIRCWKPADAPLLKQAIEINLDHLRPWMPWVSDEPEPLQAKIDRLRQFRGQFDLGQDFIYGVFSQDEQAVWGGTGLHTRVGPDALEIGYWIHIEHTHQGLATELAAALTKVAFEVNQVKRVEIHCLPHNLYSAAVPRKLGFVHEATLRQRMAKPENQLGDMMVWTLLAEEYSISPAAQAAIEAFDVIGRKIL